MPKLIKDLHSRVELLEKKLQNSNTLQKLRISNRDATYFINLKDILYLKAESNYTYIYFTNGEKLLISKTLGILAEKIKDLLFLRIHASYLINARYLSKYINSDQKIILNNQITLPVSRMNKKMMSDWIKG